MKHRTIRDTLALVDNPAQLLNVLEWCYHEQAGLRTRILVLAPTDEVTINQLREMCAFAEEEDVEVEWHHPRRSLRSGLAVVEALRSALAAARRVVIGDPFAGFVHVLLPLVAAPEVIVVDDGTATMEFAAQLAAAEPLRRWHVPGAPGPVKRTLARRATSFYRGRHVRLFTAMHVTELPSSQVQQHRYDWTRGRFAAPRVVPGRDLLGSSLVESGLVQVDAYLDAVVALAGSGGRYFAHRRENPAKLRRIQQCTGLKIVRPRVPIEIELRRGPVAGQLVSFPSSVGYTLPLVLAGVGTQIVIEPVDESMLGPEVSAHARAFLQRVEGDLELIDSRPARMGVSASA